MTKTLLLIFVAALSASAQPLGVGIKGGLPLTDLFNSAGNFKSETQRYIVGPMIELRLPAGFAIEGDALYTKANLSSPLTAAGSVISSVVDTNSWEFPVLLKKKFGGADTIGASAKPYIGAGASFRYLTGLGDLPAFIKGTGNVDKNNIGFVAGVGVEIKVLKLLRISPEVRFTRWGTDNFASGLANIWKTNRNHSVRMAWTTERATSDVSMSSMNDLSSLTPWMG